MSSKPMKRQQLIAPKLPHMFYGADYNPEQWPEEVWQEDVRLMREAGVNLVSLGIFSWASIEPRPGEYTWGWLDRIMDLLHENGIAVDLATATASPPPWLAKLHPDSLPVTRDGVTLWPGGRQQYCPSNGAYRERAAELVRKIAERYRDHPALVMWHINNEYGCHVAECFCDTSARDFRHWLQRRYPSLDALNAAWGTAFWSQRYSEWDEINPPRSAPTYANPTQQLDWRRFSSDALLQCFEAERAILKEITPDIPITTNFMSNFKPLNYWQWAAREDIVSLDSYPDPADPEAMIDAALNNDLMRSLGGGKPWVLMEQVTSQVNWRERNVLKRPGQMRLWSYQALARGANGIMFFQWRQSQAGAEKFHGAMVPHVGTEHSRVWREVTQLGAELQRLGSVQPATIAADLAIMLDWESWWALELDSKPSRAVRQIDQLRTYYAPLFRRNIALDFVGPDSDLAGYKLLLVPNLYLVRDTTADRIEQFVAGGGTLVMGFFSGIVNEHDHIRLGGYPAPFRSVLGLRVEEFDPLPADQHVELRSGDTIVGAGDLWQDMIDLEGATALATFGSGVHAGSPAITLHEFGQGRSYYLGTCPDESYLSALLDRACEEAGVAPTLEAPAGVEVVRRGYDSTAFWCLLNHNDEAATIALPSSGYDLLTGEHHDQSITLLPLGVAIVTGATNEEVSP